MVYPTRTDSWVGKRPAHARRHAARMIELRSRLPDPDVREAVLRSIPAHSYSAGRRLGQLARSLKALDPTAPASAYREAVGVWWHMAGPTAGRTLGDTHAAFERLYRSAVRKDRLAEVVAPAGGDVREVLRRLAGYLGRRFFLSCRTLGGWLGVSHETARQALSAAVAAGVLAVVTPGTPSATLREATTYRACLPDAPEPSPTLPLLTVKGVIPIDDDTDLPDAQRECLPLCQPPRIPGFHATSGKGGMS